MNTQCRKDNGQNSWPHCFAGRESKRKSQTISTAVLLRLACTLGRNLSALQVFTSTLEPTQAWTYIYMGSISKQLAIMVYVGLAIRVSIEHAGYSLE
jgi:hypothetical protein